VFPIYRHESEEAMGIWLPVMLDELIEEQDVTISFFIPNLKEQFFVIIKTKEEHADRSKKIWKKLFLERMKRATDVKHLSSIYTICVDRVATWSVSIATRK
jgi:hypothetical protein